MHYFVYYLNLDVHVLRTAFQQFSEDFWLLFEDFQRFSKTCPKATRTFPDIFQRWPKISEDNQRLPQTTTNFSWGVRNDITSYVISIITGKLSLFYSITTFHKAGNLNVKHPSLYSKNFIKWYLKPIWWLANKII